MTRHTIFFYQNTFCRSCTRHSRTCKHDTEEVSEVKNVQDIFFNSLSVRDLVLPSGTVGPRISDFIEKKKRSVMFFDKYLKSNLPADYGPTAYLWNKLSSCFIFHA